MWAISILLSSQTLLLFVVKIYFCFNRVCVCARLCMSVSIGVGIMPVGAVAHGVQSIGFPCARVTDNVNLLMWMLGTEIGLSARAARATDF